MRLIPLLDKLRQPQRSRTLARMSEFYLAPDPLAIEAREQKARNDRNRRALNDRERRALIDRNSKAREFGDTSVGASAG